MSQVTVLKPREFTENSLDEAKYNFYKTLSEKGINLPPTGIETLQINIPIPYTPGLRTVGCLS